MKIVGPIPDHIKKLMPDYQAPKPIDAQVESSADVQSEKKLQELIAGYLRQNNIPFVCPVFGKKTKITLGWPDFTFPFNGKFFGVECKVGANHPTPEQTRCLAAIELNGGIAVVVRSFEEFRRLLK